MTDRSLSPSLPAGSLSGIGRGHLAWVDTLRVAACMLVVLAHACDPFTGMFDSNPTGFITGLTMGSLTRASVPLFVMITAVVLMPLRPATTLSGFYRKRVGRLVVPLIAWSLILPVVMWAYYRFVNPSTANAMVDMSLYSGSAQWSKLYTWIFNFNFDTTPLWYLYMLVGLYLIIPVIDGWLSTASKRDVRTILIVWMASMLLPWLKMFAPLLGYVGNYGHTGILGECDWNPFGTLYYVSGFAGYVVLARYFMRWPLQWSRGKMWGVMLPMFLAGYAITVAGYIILQKHYPGDYAYLEMIFYFCGLNVLMMTVPLFTALQRVKGRAGGMMQRLAGLTFGIYLCHFPFEYIFYDLLDFPSVWPVFRLLGGAALTFAAATAVTWILSRSRFTRRLVA